MSTTKTESIKPKSQQNGSQASPTAQKMWAWVTNAWISCPSNMDLYGWYDKFREPLHDMYTAQQEEETTPKH